MTIPFKPAMLAAIFLTAMTLYFQNAENSDFLSVYLAGLSFANGQLDHIYPALKPVFDLSYASEWDALAQSRGVSASTQLFPFIYPPLWAVVASWGAPLADMSTISVWLPLVNSVLLLGCSWLGWRITRSTLPSALWLSVGFLTMATTTYGYLALAQGQPQILTSFLILLAIERSRADAPLTAGACLALAASIKLYPLLLVTLWLARKDWRAVASFAVFGAALAAASVGLAGWQLHQEFLAQISVISNSVLVTPMSYNFSALVTVIGGDVFSGPQPFAEPTPAILSLVNKGLLLATLVAAGLYAIRITQAELYTRLWPLFLIGVSFFSPMSWSFHFITALAFAPQAIASARIWPKLCLLYLAVASFMGWALVIETESLRYLIVYSLGLTSLGALALSFVLAKPAPAT